MNRLIIVGNGFDLAHGLPTGYCDFIDWVWLNMDKIDNDLVYSSIGSAIFENKNRKAILNEFQDRFPDRYIECDERGWFYNKSNINQQIERVPLLGYKNSFFGRISEQRSIQNWVDIENEYYKILKDCLNEKDNSKVKKLNEEFEQVKNLLEKYLLEEVCSKVKFDRPNDHSDKFITNFIVKPRIFEGSKFLEEFPEKDHINLKQEDNKIRDAYKDRSLRNHVWDGSIKEENLFLNFNYTFSLDVYTTFMNSSKPREVFGIASLIQIHGRLNDTDNKINFGFGDEMDKHYQRIEEKDDNEYLKYIKSFQYLQNSNYKNVLDFIDSKKFQVYIMGHSCGLSDRILLNTIFEHENCRSIKVFYHQKDDGSDNYTEIVQNISRHFNKKKMMRDKIVNKSLCQPLPQNIRFEKITFFNLV